MLRHVEHEIGAAHLQFLAAGVGLAVLIYHADGFAGVQDYPKLAARLMERGVDETLVRRIFWENALGVMEVCCM